MITGFENSHNMFREQKPMEVRTLPKGLILPRKQVDGIVKWKWHLRLFCSRLMPDAVKTRLRKG